MKRIVCSSLALVAVLFWASPAAAQHNSTEVTATLTAILPESLTVTLSAGAAGFALTGGSATNAADTTLTATTTWTLSPARTALTLYGYFSVAATALDAAAPANTIDIPSSRSRGERERGSARVVRPDHAAGFGGAGAGRVLFTQAITLLTSSGTRNDTLALNINLAGYTLPADTYTGVLRIR